MGIVFDLIFQYSMSFTVDCRTETIHHKQDRLEHSDRSMATQWPVSREEDRYFLLLALRSLCALACSSRNCALSVHSKKKVRLKGLMVAFFPLNYQLLPERIIWFKLGTVRKSRGLTAVDWG